MRRLNPTLADLGAIDVEGDVAAFAEPAAVVAELHPHLALAGGQRLAARNREALSAEQVVAVSRLPVLEVEAPAAEGAALGDDELRSDRRRFLTTIIEFSVIRFTPPSRAGSSVPTSQGTLCRVAAVDEHLEVPGFAVLGSLGVGEARQHALAVQR